MPKFELGQEVELLQSGERGMIAGRQERLEAPTSYLVRYIPEGSDQQQDRWLEEHQLVAVD